MRQNPSFAMTDVARAASAAHRRENPWMTLVSMTDAAGSSRRTTPVLLDDDRDDITIVGHVGRPDDVDARARASASCWSSCRVRTATSRPAGTATNPSVPTWNFVSAHLYGIPELLDADENLRVLERARRPLRGAGCREPRLHAGTAERTAPTSTASRRGTVGFRLHPDHAVRRQAQAEPEPPGRGRRDDHRASSSGDGPYASPALAAEMRRAHEALRAARA